MPSQKRQNCYKIALLKIVCTTKNQSFINRILSVFNKLNDAVIQLIIIMQQNSIRNANSYQQNSQSGATTYRPLTYTQGQVYKSNHLIEPVEKTDAQFYNSLTHFKPLCYSGHGAPLFLVNKGWYLSLGCVAVMDAMFIMVLLIFLRSAGEGLKPMSAQDIRKYKIINIVLMSCVNISYFLTQFMNPGIRNLSTITEQQYQKNGKYFCSSCNGYRTQLIQHCRDCDACIQDLDHHCAFFSKCIGGLQKYVFYAFLCFVLLGFLCLIVTMTANIGL